MTFTYNPDLSDAVSRVRFLVGDISAPGVIPDETIQSFLSKPLSEGITAARMARGLAAKYAKMVEVTVDDQTVKGSDVSQRYIDMAERLEREAAADAATRGTAFGGIIVTGLGDCRGPLDDPCCGWR